MQLTLLTPQRKVVDGEKIEELFAPGSEGQLDILEGHANFVTSLETGVLRWRRGNDWSSVSVTTGLLEINEGHITIAADVVELPKEIDVARARAAEAKARAKLDEGGLDEPTFRKQELKLRRAMARQSVAQGN